MVKKSNFIKNLLTTASAMAVLAGSAQSAMATLSTTKANSAHSVANTWVTDGADNTAPAAGAGNTTFLGGAHTLDFDLGGNFGTLNLNGYATTVTVTKNGVLESLESIVNDITGANTASFAIAKGAVAGPVAGNTTAAKADFNINGAVTQEFKGVKALGNLTLSNVGATAKFSQGTVTINGTINGSVAGNGIVEVNAVDVTFARAIGAGKSVGSFKLNNGKSATLNADITVNGNIELGDASTLTIGANVTAADINAANINNGTLKFAGASTVTAKIGHGNKLLKVGIDAGAVELNSAVYKATTTEFTNAASALKLTAAATVESDFTTTVNGKGKIIINGNNQIIDGTFGTDALRLEAIEFATDHALTLGRATGNAVDLYVNNITTAKTDDGGLTLQADTVNIYGNIGTADKKLFAVGIASNYANNGPATVNVKGGKIYASIFDIAYGAHGAQYNKLVLEDGAEIHANVTAVNQNNGVIVVKGNATINGVIGDNVGGKAAVINQIEFNTDGKILTVAKNTIATGGANNGVHFTADGTLNLTENADLALTAPVTIAANANGMGSIMINGADSTKTVTITGNIGDVATKDATTKALKLLEVKGGANLTLENNTYIKTLDMGTHDRILTLSDKGASIYKIENFIHDEGKTVVNLVNDTTLATGTNLGKIKELHFNVDQVLTIGNGVDISVVNGITNVGQNLGTLVFEGGSTVDAFVGLNNALKAIQVKGKGETAHFKQDVKLFTTANGANGTIVISDGAIAKFEGNVTGVAIDGLVANQGILEFANATAKEMDMKIGHTSKLNTIILSGSDVKFNHIPFATNFTFKNDGPTTATIVVDNTGADYVGDLEGNITTTSTARLHDIKLALKNPNSAHTAIFTTNLDVGTEANPLGNIIINDKIKINVNSNIFAGIITETDDKGMVSLIKAGTSILNLGDLNKGLERIEILQNAVINGDVNATDLLVDANITATFKNTNFKSAKGMQLEAGSTAAFVGQTYILSTIYGDNIGDGIVTFDSGVEIDSKLGDIGLNQIYFSSSDVNDRIVVKEDLTATNIKVDKATFIPQKNITLTGATSFAGATIDLNEGTKLTLSGNSAATGDITIKLNRKKTTPNTLGSIVVDGAGNAFDISGVNSLQIEVDNKADLPDSNGKDFTLFETKNGASFPAFPLNALPIKDANKFAEWSFVSNSVIHLKNNAEAKLKEIMGTSDANLFVDAGRLGDANNTGDAKAVQADFGTMATDSQIKDAMHRLSNPIVAAGVAINNAISGAGQTTLNRIGELSPHPTAGIQTADAGITGVNAGDGDDRTRYGAWMSPFYNTANQGIKDGNPSYRSTSCGATIGVDTMANADMSLGVALSYIKTEVKHKDKKAGDKTKADTYMFTMYGIQQLTNEWFMQGVATFSSSKVKNNEKRGTSTGYQVAKGNFDSTSYSGELLFGYLHSINDVKVTPLGGFAVSRLNDGGYKETGTTSQNLTITKKAITKLEGILGARVQMSNIYSAEGMEVVPELHAYIRHNFLNKNANVIAKLDGLNNQFTAKAAKTNKTMYNLGTSLNAKYGMYEYGAGYDLNLSNKYVGHQGSVKVRVNF